MGKGLLAKSTVRKSESRNPEQDRLRSEAVKEPTVRINANVTRSLHQEFKLKCISENRDMTQVLIEIIKDYVAS
jgi:hypothetical protein